MLEGIEQILFKEKPDLVLVYGDTNSTLAGALAAAKLNVPIAHVEAGLRSFNQLMPEEVNRVLTDHMASLLFAPTAEAVKNLRREGFSENSIRQTGDVMFDAAMFYGNNAESKSSILSQLGLKPKKYVLATIHRAENTDNPVHLENCFSALGILSERFPVVLPLHPRTEKALKSAGLLENISGALRLIEPAGYLDMILLEKNARLIVTDSGGVQKEAFFHRVPCVTLRDETEWMELIALGWNRLASPSSLESMLSAFNKAFESKTRNEGSPFGEGRSAELIVKALLEWRGYK
jgi:UDP-GlcNAc3NAcA epimerase